MVGKSCLVLNATKIKISSFYNYSICFSGDSYPIKQLSLHELLPSTPYYLTYEGSTTTPACHETVTWVLVNKPAYISKEQVRILLFHSE